MYFEISRKELLNPLKMVASVVEQRQTLPILGHLLMRVKDQVLHLTATDSEVEIVCSIPLLEASQDDETTVPKKMFDIVRSLPETSQIQVTNEDNHIILKSGKSRFTLSCLPAQDFPESPQIQGAEFQITSHLFKKLVSKTAFCVAINDVRYYLTGLLLEIAENKMSLVGTDGHRMAVAECDFDTQETTKVIIPRKAVLELLKLLPENENNMKISVSDSHVKFELSDSLVMSSKLIDGSFPDWRSVVPSGADKIVLAQTALLKQSLARVSLLSNEKYKGVKLSLLENLMVINARNPQQEEATEELPVEYQGEEMEVGFNGVYITEALNVVSTPEVKLAFSEPNASVLMTEEDTDDYKWIIMSMRL